MRHRMENCRNKVLEKAGGGEIQSAGEGLPGDSGRNIVFIVNYREIRESGVVTDRTVGLLVGGRGISCLMALFSQ